MTKKDLKLKISEIIDRKQITYAKYLPCDSNNPQIKEIKSRLDAEITVFISIFDALNNNNVMLNCY